MSCELFPVPCVIYSKSFNLDILYLQVGADTLSFKLGDIKGLCWPF